MWRSSSGVGDLMALELGLDSLHPHFPSRRWWFVVVSTAFLFVIDLFAKSCFLKKLRQHLNDDNEWPG